MYLSEALNGRRNNFDHLRLIAAITVIISHSFPLNGITEPSAFFFKYSYGSVAVAVFFMISGFLITNSWFRTENPVRFFKARCLRILPSLYIVVLLCVFVIGPVVTALPLRQYFTSFGSYKYLESLTVLFIKFNIPGVFLNNPVSATVNGPIWTLRYEFAFYIVLLVGGMAGLLKKRIITLSLFAVMLALTYLNTYTYFDHIIQLSCFFLAGMVFYQYREAIPLKGSYALVCLAVFLLSGFFRPLDAPLFVIFGSYLVFYLALSPKLRLPSLEKFGDLSYGLYIYAYPIQQTVIWYFKGSAGFMTVFAISSAITLVFAFLSWHLVEKRALSLKKRSFKSLFSPKKALNEAV